MRLKGRGPKTASERRLLAEEPALDAGAAFCLRAWQELESCRMPEQRPVTRGNTTIYVPIHGPIPYTAIATWCHVNDLDVESMQLISGAMRILDVERSDRLSSELRSKS